MHIKYYDTFITTDNECPALLGIKQIQMNAFLIGNLHKIWSEPQYQSLE